MTQQPHLVGEAEIFRVHDCEAARCRFGLDCRSVDKLVPEKSLAGEKNLLLARWDTRNRLDPSVHLPNDFGESRRWRRLVIPPESFVDLFQYRHMHLA